MSDRFGRDRSKRKLRLGLPKGSLQDTTVKLFALAGFDELEGLGFSASDERRLGSGVE